MRGAATLLLTIIFICGFILIGVGVFKLTHTPNPAPTTNSPATAPTFSASEHGSLLKMSGNTFTPEPGSGQCLDWSKGVIQDSAAACTSAKPTLKELICKLDALACKRKLQYEIDQQWVGYRGKYWVAFAWPKDKTWSEKEWWYVADAPLDRNFTTKEEAINRLLEMLQNEKPNMLASPPSNASKLKPELEPEIDGPTNCDPHRQCK